MSDLQIETTRGARVESRHRVMVAVVDAAGRLVARVGDASLETFWRSAAKPFQAMPMVMDGGADRFGLDPRELALCCASHSSEPAHLAVIDSILRKLEVGEEALACGPHTPLGAAVAEDVRRTGITLTPRWSNCSGKHAGMLALARHHGWSLEGYNVAGHPVQLRILEEMARWTGTGQDRIGLAVDGCNTVCFALGLRAMALAYARFGVSEEPPAIRLRQAMTGHPDLVGGTGRPCTDLMAAFVGGLVAKVGADGVYSAALPTLGLGISLKVVDGDGRSAPIALMAVLRSVLVHHGADPAPLERCQAHATAEIRNTRGLVVGAIRPAGGLRYL